MIYNKETGELSLKISEFVTVSRRSLSPIPTRDFDEPEYATVSSMAQKIAKLENSFTKSLEYRFDIDGYSFLLTGHITICANTAALIFETERNPDKPSKEELAEARGEGFVAAYIHALDEGLSEIELNIIFVNINDRKSASKRELVKISALEAFFKKCKAALPRYARPEIERVTKRLPTLSALKFPYKKVREGQEEFMSAVYKTLSRESRLYAAAPTGTGKTISAVYPALLALGRGKCDKIFYLTPKNTNAIAVKECLELCASHGAIIRSVILSSKERLCKNGLLCLDDKRLCKNSATNKITEATLAVYNEQISVVTQSTIDEFSKKYSVCPHELALSYSELCDLVIGDVNYLFSPDAYIRRFFTKGGRFAFLIDEAHNLPDRARDMFSVSVGNDEILAPTRTNLFGEFSGIRKCAITLERCFFNTLYPYLKDDIRKNEDGVLVGAAHISEIPTPLYDAMETAISECETELLASYREKDEEKNERIRFIKRYIRHLKLFLSTMYKFDEHYEMFIFFEDEKISAKLFCIDPRERIGEKLKMGTSAVFFSGTLSPIHYYRSILGGDRSSETLELDSPFDKGQLSVSIMDKVSTRYSEREKTLLGVARVIAAAVSARRGNYMIFTPSFAYAEALQKAFSAKYPKIRTLLQRHDMSNAEKESFLAEFSKDERSYLIAFCVMGGIYSEGIDLAGDRLIGAIVVGIGLPALSYEREAIAAYYQEKYDEGREFAYIYPGINRVLQAAGRVIRREDDRGIIVLIDDRFDDPIYKKLIPRLWSGMRFVASAQELKIITDKFWNEEKHE